MVTDRGRSDDAQAFDAVQQHKCLAPLWRSIRDVLATKHGRARDFGARLKGLLQDAIPLWRAWHAGEVADFPTEAQALWDAITQHLRPRMCTDPNNQRVLNGIGRQHDQGHLLRCLEDPQGEPTNNRAERVLRPAVSARKVSQCANNPAGAQAFAAFKSLVQTLAKQGVDSMVEGLYRIFRSTRLHAVPP
jgi:transposase